jgi:hypothetical protein
MRLVARHRGSSYWSSRPLCRDGGCCPLACRRCHVCVGWVVISIFDLRMFRPVARCASAWSRSCLFPDLRACVHRQVVWFNCCRRCLPA